MKKSPTKKFGITDMSWTSIGLGTWMMDKTPKESIKALRAGMDAGANHVDTAEMYGAGRVEEIVGEAMMGLRDKIYLVSKVLPENSGYQPTIDACHRSLKRLKTDYLDIYLLHWLESDTSMEETFRAFEKLKQDGKIKHWGVSNFDVDELEKAVSLVGDGKIACNQVLYHLKERSVEADLIPWCQEKNIPFVAYSPLDQGKLPRNKVLDEIAKSHNATPAQIALAFLTRKDHVFAIPKSSSEQNIRDNVHAMTISLSKQDIDKISEAFPLKTRSSLPMI